jgi:hypothetical protein
MIAHNSAQNRMSPFPDDGRDRLKCGKTGGRDQFGRLMLFERGLRTSK